MQGDVQKRVKKDPNTLHFHILNHDSDFDQASCRSCVFHGNTENNTRLGGFHGLWGFGR